MSSFNFKFRLVKAAKKGGGDKYECDMDGELRDFLWTIYVPQAISRPEKNSAPINELEITVKF